MRRPVTEYLSPWVTRRPSRDELLELKLKVSRSMGDEYASIFEAHAMIVADASFSDTVVQKIENEQVNAEWAMSEVQEELEARFARADASRTIDSASSSNRSNTARDLRLRAVAGIVTFSPQGTQQSRR